MTLIKSWMTGLVLLTLTVASSAVAAAQPNCAEIRAKYQCPAEKKKITLSFDDGVADVTPKLLNILKKERVKGTFFILANKVDCRQYENSCKASDPNSPHCNSLKLCQQRVNTLDRIKREGHMIGSHSYFHDRHSELPANKLQWNIQKSKIILQD